MDFGKPRLCDPLVINLDSNIANVSDQKFYFDIDADGSDDSISMLNSGSGYLALDRNGDGIINDGSELFGTQSGNGFADLAAYDKKMKTAGSMKQMKSFKNYASGPKTRTETISF
ncbi:MAG: hypothetical protein ACLR78_02345 [Roseburia sp.]